MSRGETYEEFVDKFKPKLTTDDCYTPPKIYAAVRDWACAKYGIDPAKIVRPFYPGGDYENYKYPDGAVVLDNPPFSILSKICAFYLDRQIPFFLFAPSLTAFGGKKITTRMNHIFCNAEIVYENGAIVKTAFVTSFGGDIVAQTAPDLGKTLRRLNDEARHAAAKQLPKYEYPAHVLTAAMMQRYALRGIDFEVRRGECVSVAGLDSQKEKKKAIYGYGLLLSDKKAAERLAAERLAAERLAAERLAAERLAAVEVQQGKLSERELDIISHLGT